MSAGSDAAQSRVDDAQRWVQLANRRKFDAADDYEQARQELAAAQIARDKARWLSAPCPICDADIDDPCVDIGNATHTKRAVVAAQLTEAKS